MNNDFLKELKFKARDKDGVAFKEFMLGWISFSELKEKIFNNNRMSKEIREQTSDEEFLDWVKRLGWYVKD